MQEILFALGILALFGGFGGTLNFGLGSLAVGGTAGAVLIVLGVLL